VAFRIKRPQSGEVMQRGYLVDKGKGFFRCGRPHFLSIIFSIAIAWAGEVEPVRTRGSIFRNFVRMSFTDGAK